MPKVRKEIPELEKLVQVGRKKFVRYEEGAQLYSMGLHTFQELAKNSGLLRTFQDGAQKRNVRIVLIIWLLAAEVGFYLTAGLCGVAAAVVGLAVFFYYYQFSRKQFGGITGDLAGYFLQLCELFMLAVLALF